MSGFSIKSRLKSFYFAGRGVCFMLSTQHNAWLHLVATVVVIAAGIALRISAADWKWLVATIVAVWIAETMNTAFEYLCDVVSPEHNQAVMRAKDIAAGAVLICAVGAAIMGALIFVPYL